MQPLLNLFKPTVTVYENGAYSYEYTPENGQITLDTEFGKEMFDLAVDPRYTTFFEVGTWKGNGTTRCLAEGIMRRYHTSLERNAHIWSLESNIHIFREAIGFWNQMPFPPLHLLYGCLHREIMSEEEIKGHPCYSLVADHFKDWYKQDTEDIRQAPIVDLSLLPDLDVIILDGGEFSGNGDWASLKTKNPKVVCLDDVRVIKNYSVCEELRNSKEWHLFKEGSERNGWAIFTRIE